MAVLTLTGKAIDWERRTLDPTMLVQWQPDYGSINQQYKGSLRTCAHQDYMDQRAFRRFGVGIYVIQPPYNTGVPASAGTHDLDAMRDWGIPGIGWDTCQHFGRECGEFCWARTPAQGFTYHCHGGTLPLPRPADGRYNDFPTRVGIYVPGQLVDYYNHAFGLAGMHTPGSDRSWFPPSIDATVFNLKHYIDSQKEKDMEYKDWSDKSKKEFVTDIKEAILGAPVNVRNGVGKGVQEVTVRQAVARAANGVVVMRNSTDDILEAIEAADSDN